MGKAEQLAERRLSDVPADGEGVAGADGSAAAIGAVAADDHEFHGVRVVLVGAVVGGQALSEGSVSGGAGVFALAARLGRVSVPTLRGRSWCWWLRAVIDKFDRCGRRASLCFCALAVIDVAGRTTVASGPLAPWPRP